MVGARKQQLRGREDAIALVRDFVKRELKFAYSRSREVPVLEFTGGRGSGKTALLKELDERLDENVPHAFIDFEQLDGKSMREFLLDAVRDLERRCGRYGHLRFPRFRIGFWATARSLDFDGVEDVNEQVWRALTEAGHHPTKIQSASRLWTGDSGSVRNTSYNDGGTTVQAGQHIGDIHINQTDRPRPRGMFGNWRSRRRFRHHTWYGHQDRQLSNDPLQELRKLNTWAFSENNKAEADELLLSAFLADLRHAFHGLGALSRTMNCVLLLDNIDAPAGRRFQRHLDRVREQHAEPAQRTDPDPLTVVATRRMVERNPVSLTLASRGAPVPTVDGALRSHARPVQLPDLSEASVENMVATLGLRVGGNRRITAALYRFTAGHPGATRVMLDALPRAAEPDNLLMILRTCPPSEDAPLEQQLLDQFLPTVDPKVSDDLATCAASATLAQALRLVDSGLLISSERQRHELLFTSELWTPAEDGSATLKPVLRRLLLRQLAARTQDHVASWQVVHEWLRQDSDGDEQRQLYHALALEDVEHVTSMMAELLQSQNVGQWLELLYSITTAPNMLDQYQSPRSHIDELTKWARASEALHAPLARLIVALWITHDPLFPRVLHEDISWDFRAIAPYSPNGRATLLEESRKYDDMVA